MSAFDRMAQERMEEISFLLLQFALQVPEENIRFHQIEARFTALCPLLVGFASKFTALVQEHGLEVAKAIKVQPHEFQLFCEVLEGSLGEKERRLFQARSISGSERPLVY